MPIRQLPSRFLRGAIVPYSPPFATSMFLRRVCNAIRITEQKRSLNTNAVSWIILAVIILCVHKGHHGIGASGHLLTI